MGQSNSRFRNVFPTRPAVSTASSSTLAADSTANSSSNTQAIKQSRRSRIRQSISNLVKPQSPPSVHTRLQGVAAKKKIARFWKKSRRRLNGSSPYLSPTSGLSSSAGPSSPPPPPMIDKDEVVRPADPDIPGLHQNQDIVADPSLPSSSTAMETPSEAPETTAHVPTNADLDPSTSGAGQHNAPLQEAAEIPVQRTTSLNSPSTITSTNSGSIENTSLEPPADTPSLSPISPPPTHQTAFPSPGTLVVVQGVVHTTDVPRSNSTPTAPIRSDPSPPPVPRSRTITTILHRQLDFTCPTISHH
jgi:hypothetical protein